MSRRLCWLVQYSRSKDILCYTERRSVAEIKFFNISVRNLYLDRRFVYALFLWLRCVFETLRQYKRFLDISKEVLDFSLLFPR